MNMNRVMAFINAELLSSSITSIWTALDVRQLKSMTHLFECTSHPGILRATMFHGPNTSTPTMVNGGVGKTMSAGRSFMICWAEGLRSFLQITHLCKAELIIFLIHIIQKPWDRRAPSVNTLPWCCTFSWNLLTSKMEACNFLSIWSCDFGLWVTEID